MYMELIFLIIAFVSPHFTEGARRYRFRGICCCVHPPFPKHGSYEATTFRISGASSRYLVLNATCDEGYTLDGSESIICNNGFWTDKLPKCVPEPLPTSAADMEDRLPEENNCILPEYPEHGTFTTNVGNGKPGEALDIVAVNVTCEKGYALSEPQVVYCYSGLWSKEMPKCIAQCRIPEDPSTRYRCPVSENLTDEFRDCNEYESSGVKAIPECRPLYHPTANFTSMECKDGEWSNSAHKCTLDVECGIMTPEGEEQRLSGQSAKHAEAPWHSAIYKKTKKSYRHICAGSLVSNNIIITAAHCFWDSSVGKLPASDFAVAVGKLHRDYNSKLGKPQWSNVESVELPARFRGLATNLQDDIAVVELSAPVEYQAHIRPVCIDFDEQFEMRQVQPGHTGKVAGWGLVDGSPAQVLQVLDMPYVDIDTCINRLPASFIPYITSDKICAGNDETTLCETDGGAGLTFPEMVEGTMRHYLRGVVSTPLLSIAGCNTNPFTTFTSLIKHKQFIKRFTNGSNETISK